MSEEQQKRPIREGATIKIFDPDGRLFQTIHIAAIPAERPEFDARTDDEEDDVA